MYLFNPENDLALANFSANYTPPTAAIKIAEDLAMLPLWYAPDGAKIVAGTSSNEFYLSQLKEIFSLKASLISFSDISQFPQEKIIPWGWNPALRKRLIESGRVEDKLPSIDELKLLRDYSSRQHAVKLLAELKKLEENFCGESHYFYSVNDVVNYLSSFSENKVMKMPNSGSGKGLVWVLGEMTEKQTDWCRRVIREQGGVVVEPILNKAHDFAMEFFLENGKTSFAGYSLFTSAASGAYMGNLLLSDIEIENYLSSFAQRETLHWLKTFYIQKLPEYFPTYNGYIGVDMMICKTANTYQIQPCVELNMRMNMGLVARIFYDRFVNPSCSGSYRVDFFKKKGQALAHKEQMQKEFPLAVDEGRIASGFLSLTPVDNETQFMAWTTIQQ